MIEEILSLQRTFYKDFGYGPKYLIIGQNQFLKFAMEFNEKYKCNLKSNGHELGEIGTFNNLKIIIVTSDIYEVI